MPKNLRVVFLGDIVGQPGCLMLQKWAAKLKEQHKADALIVNGENACNSGKGISPRLVRLFKECGVDVITSGNHIWYKREIYTTLNEREDILRPANYPSDCPGKGYTIFEVQDCSVAVINLQGTIFMKEKLAPPLRTVESLLTFLQSKTNIIFVDFHAEATSEKQCMAFFLDGKVSGVFGTHTHVQTSDERILPKGTAFITDVGSTGAMNSVIGDKFDIIVRHFLTQMPIKFEVETVGPMALCGVVVEVDPETGKTCKIERIRLVDEEIQELLKKDKK